MAWASVRRDRIAVCAASLLLLATVALVPRAGAADTDTLEARLADAREEAGAIAGALRDDSAALIAAREEANVAAAREAELSGLLAEGRERTAELDRAVAVSEERLAEQRERLRRALRALAERLVAIYESGTPDELELILDAEDLGELEARADYLEAIADADSALAARVGEVRDAVQADAAEVRADRDEAVAHERELVAARTEIGEVRASAEDAAARLDGAVASRRASLARLRGKIDGWVEEVELARAADRAEAESEVGRWLGGPYSIPTYIVMCESGGNYSALNASSGAGGAYQIIPSTWEAYGGKGAPHEAPKAEQDRIAAEIWADSGPSAWVCG